MYFTESEDAIENCTVLNTEFLAQYDTEELENKLRVLFPGCPPKDTKRKFHQHRQGERCIRFRKKGDYYTVVLGD